MEDKGLTIYFTNEDFQSFIEVVNNMKCVNVDDKDAHIFLEEKGVTLHFSFDNFCAFKKVLNNVEALPKWWLCLN
jgi:hypothetical protein